MVHDKLWPRVACMSLDMWFWYSKPYIVNHADIVLTYGTETARGVAIPVWFKVNPVPNTYTHTHLCTQSQLPQNPLLSPRSQTFRGWGIDPDHPIVFWFFLLLLLLFCFLFFFCFVLFCFDFLCCFICFWNCFSSVFLYVIYCFTLVLSMLPKRRCGDTTKVEGSLILDIYMYYHFFHSYLPYYVCIVPIWQGLSDIWWII